MARFATAQDADRGAEMEVVDDTGHRFGMFLTLVGADSERYREKQREQQKRRFARINRGALMPGPEELEAQSLELTVAATTGWRGTGPTGEPLPAFSPEAALKVYTDYRSIREQADHFINDRSNFLPSAAALS